MRHCSIQCVNNLLHVPLSSCQCPCIRFARVTRQWSFHIRLHPSQMVFLTTSISLSPRVPKHNNDDLHIGKGRTLLRKSRQTCLPTHVYLDNYSCGRDGFFNTLLQHCQQQQQWHRVVNKFFLTEWDYTTFATAVGSVYTYKTYCGHGLQPLIATVGSFFRIRVYWPRAFYMCSIVPLCYL